MSRRGWALLRVSCLAAAVLFLSPVHPVPLVTVPLALALVARRARDPRFLVLAAFLLLVSFWPSPDEGADPLWKAERGWALLLGGAFVAVTALGSGWRFTSRALAALGLAALSVGATGLARPGLLTELDWWVGRRLHSATLAAETLLRGVVPGDAGATLTRVMDLQVLLHPAFLGLGSLAALGVVRYVCRRLEGRGEALGPFREFRFADQLVWILIVALGVFLLPVGETVARAAENAMLFMGGLYLLRGIAVLFWVAAATLAPGPPAALAVVMGVLLYPLVLALAFALGVGDTWVDLRRRLAERFPGRE